MSLRSMVGRTLDVVDRGNRLRRLRDRWTQDRRNAWLHRVTNVAHVGANSGQEAALYDSYGLGVLWIEPIPSVYQQLKERIRPYPRQSSINALISDVAGGKYTFHISNNEGASSSFLDLAEHRQIWPEIEFRESIELVSDTLDRILESEERTYDGLVVNAQGSELLVLKGATRHIQGFRFMQIRAPDFNAYEGCATVADIERFLGELDFAIVRRDLFAAKADGTGTYFDLLFETRRKPS